MNNKVVYIQLYRSWVVKIKTHILMKLERGKKREEKMGETRENWFVYIICWYNLFYFNELHIKIETRMLDGL